MFELTGYFDGAAEPNPGHGSAGWELQNSAGEVVADGHAYLGPTVTNNEAEYQALQFLLAAAHELGCRSLLVHGDSKLVINQVNGEWKCNAANMKPHLAAVQAWFPHFDVLQFEWLRREGNTRADDLSKRALEAAGITVTERDYQRRKKAASPSFTSVEA